MLSSMMTISNNKFCWRAETSDRGAACKHIEVELIISLGKLVRGASPQDVGHQVDTRMQRKAKEVSFPAPFQAAGDETRQKT